MTRWIAALGLLLAVGGCSLASSTPVPSVAGRETYRIECRYTMANCQEEAKKVCGGPYDVVSHGNRSCADCGVKDVVPDDSAIASADSERGKSPVFRGILRVRCH